MAVCQNCGSAYDFDVIVPNKIWTEISPRKSEGGLLCPSCICEKLKNIGWSAGFMLDIDTVNPNADYHEKPEGAK